MGTPAIYPNGPDWNDRFKDIIHRCSGEDAELVHIEIETTLCNGTISLRLIFRVRTKIHIII